jgi:hypothetical protein
MRMQKRGGGGGPSSIARKSVFAKWM